MTTIKNKGVNIVTLEPYCGRELRIQPNKSVDEEKEFKHINSRCRKKKFWHRPKIDERYQDLTFYVVPEVRKVKM